MTDLLEWLDERVADVLRSDEWFNYLSAGRLLENNGLAVLRDEVVSGAVPVEAMRDVFRGRFYRQWLDEAYRDEPALREFDLTVQEQALAKFQQLDRTWITNGFSRIRPPLLARLPQAKDLQGNIPETSEIGVLQRELNKKRRHLPLRRLFAAIPNLLPRLKPCMMMSPLAVSTYLNSEHIKFDVVIFDEASQVRPHDAICAIYRGAQLVVGGDQKQLPPTSFFERMAAGEEGEEQDALEQNTNDYESILDVCATLGVRRERLKWHYRSRRESLIAFSNRYFYNGDLVTFPSVKDVGNASGVGFDYVAEAVWTGGGVNLIEAQRLADAVMTHAAERPNKTLGVITMNQKQQMLLIDEIDKRRRANPKLEPFFGQDKLDPFFVKNLENVQGDERDYIFLGVGFAKNPQTGQLSHNFGPLNQQGGERRLNVAVTRAREALMVFSSIRAGDIDLRRTQSDGARLLRDYLDFAERGTGALQSAAAKQSGIELDTTFESEVERSLRERGLQVARQVGCSEYRIDLALLDPEVPGAYVLGIECDGESYNSSATARDRDRLRHQVLENLGWRLVRVWSTDWVRNPDRQIERIIMAYQDALKAKLAPPKKEDKEPPAKVVEPLSPAKPAREKKAREIVYESIDEVPDEDLVESAQTLLGKFGSMELDDLMLAVARQFGFQRTGTRIRQRLMAIILACVDRKILERDQTRIHLRKDEGMA
jgi:very-short-patch-repair endonuclease